MQMQNIIATSLNFQKFLVNDSDLFNSLSFQNKT